MLRPLLLATPPLGHLICLRSIVSASIRAAFLPTRAMKRKLMGGLRSSLMPNIKVYTTAALQKHRARDFTEPLFSHASRRVLPLPLAVLEKSSPPRRRRSHPRRG